MVLEAQVHQLQCVTFHSHAILDIVEQDGIVGCNNNETSTLAYSTYVHIYIYIYNHIIEGVAAIVCHKRMNTRTCQIIRRLHSPQPWIHGSMHGGQ